MHRKEASRILAQVSCGFVTKIDYRNLKLHLYQLRIESLHQLVVDKYPIDLVKFEIMVVEAELDACRAGLPADSVQLVGSLLPVRQGCGDGSAKVDTII